ncbi:MAG: alpha-ketoglutarate-dependent dioxygenase AlkB, partial [Acidimicrobiia bacterium]
MVPDAPVTRRGPDPPPRRRRHGAVPRRHRPQAPRPHRRLTDARRLRDVAPCVTDRYRDGRDGQAFHRDRDLRHCEETIIAVLSFGSTRPWLLRPRGRSDKWIAENGGATIDLAPAGGDLVVMGGRCQVDWEHSVPQLR